MSNPNTFNKELQQTSIDSAYQFSSFSPYIMNGGLNRSFSQTCIFCSSKNTMNLMNDGSFKQCKTCNKQFKPSLINNQIFNPPYKK